MLFSNTAGSRSLRSVLPAVVPAWTSHQYLHQDRNSSLVGGNGAADKNILLSRLTQTTHGGSDASTASVAAAADVAIVAVPSQGSTSTGTVLNAYDITGSYGLKVFPNTHNLNGLCSVSGEHLSRFFTMLFTYNNKKGHHCTKTWSIC